MIYTLLLLLLLLLLMKWKCENLKTKRKLYSWWEKETWNYLREEGIGPYHILTIITMIFETQTHIIPYKLHPILRAHHLHHPRPRLGRRRRRRHQPFEGVNAFADALQRLVNDPTKVVQVPHGETLQPFWSSQDLEHQPCHLLLAIFFPYLLQLLLRFRDPLAQKRVLVHLWSKDCQ